MRLLYYQNDKICLTENLLDHESPNYAILLTHGAQTGRRSATEICNMARARTSLATGRFGFSRIKLDVTDSSTFGWTRVASTIPAVQSFKRLLIACFAGRGRHQQAVYICRMSQPLLPPTGRILLGKADGSRVDGLCKNSWLHERHYSLTAAGFSWGPGRNQGTTYPPSRVSR